MTARGMGAAVVRKEDQRFITGKGRYTDDINLPGQTYACFVRSPHAHARITGIDKASAEAMPGVLAVLTGENAKADGLGNLVCGWLVKSKDGSPMKRRPHPVLAQGRSAMSATGWRRWWRKRRRRRGMRRSALAVDYELVACGRRHCRGCGRRAGARRGARQPDLRLEAGGQGGGRRRVRPGRPRHPYRARQQAAGHQSDRAARGARPTTTPAPTPPRST